MRIILRNNHLTQAHRVFSFSRPTLSALQPNNKDRSWSQYAQTIINNKEINTIPNIITISRIIASPLISVAIAQDMKYAALGGCVVFGLTDWLDGYLAKRLNQRTVLGAFLDPMADKVLIGALTLGKSTVHLCYLALFLSLNPFSTYYRFSSKRFDTRISCLCYSWKGCGSSWSFFCSESY